MNTVQSNYSPPRIAAFLLAAIVFAIYQFGWRDFINAAPIYGIPVPTALAIVFSLIIGYGFSMIGWLIVRTKGQFLETFRPTRGRIIGSICLTLATPFVVFSYIPWIFLGMLPLAIPYEPIEALLIFAAISLVTYPLAAMIVRHTYDRRGLRIGLFALCFWTAYSVLMLRNGVQIFAI